jgi:hypothetical protein
MRQLTAGLATMAIAVTGCAVTGCAATATTSSGKTPAGVTSHSATTSTKTSRGAGGLAQWVVVGTFETKGVHAQPLSGVVTFRDSATGHTVNVTVGTSGKFSLGLVSGTYSATGQTKHSDSPCSAPVTVTVPAGQLTRVSLVCQAS